MAKLKSFKARLEDADLHPSLQEAVHYVVKAASACVLDKENLTERCIAGFAKQPSGARVNVTRLAIWLLEHLRGIYQFGERELAAANYMHNQFTATILELERSPQKDLDEIRGERSLTVCVGALLGDVLPIHGIKEASGRSAWFLAHLCRREHAYSLGSALVNAKGMVASTAYSAKRTQIMSNNAGAKLALAQVGEVERVAQSAGDKFLKELGDKLLELAQRQ